MARAFRSAGAFLAPNSSFAGVLSLRPFAVDAAAFWVAAGRNLGAAFCAAGAPEALVPSGPASCAGAGIDAAATTRTASVRAGLAQAFMLSPASWQRRVRPLPRFGEPLVDMNHQGGCEQWGRQVYHRHRDEGGDQQPGNEHRRLMALAQQLRL